jgi:hypothetical protein
MAPDLPLFAGMKRLSLNGNEAAAGSALRK